VLVASLGVFVALSPAQTPAPKRPAPKLPAAAQQNVAAEYQAGISQLRVAKAYLQKAGDIAEPGMMNNGISSLQTARAEFEKAANDWGGRKQKAIALIDQVLKDLQTGIDWAKEHKTY
jgi:hypothetical protein